MLSHRTFGMASRAGARTAVTVIEAAEHALHGMKTALAEGSPPAAAAAAAPQTWGTSILEEQGKTLALCLQIGVNNGLKTIGAPLRVQPGPQALQPSIQVRYLGEWLSIEDGSRSD